MEINGTSFIVNLDFETIKFPPVMDILVLGKKVPQGKFGVLHSFELISPDVFDLLEVDNEISENVDAVIINKNILKKIPADKIIEILASHVFPYVAKGESLKVNMNIQIFQNNIKGDLNHEC